MAEKVETCEHCFVLVFIMLMGMEGVFARCYDDKLL